jgi:hypothetical protein
VAGNNVRPSGGGVSQQRVLRGNHPSQGIEMVVGMEADQRYIEEVRWLLAGDGSNYPVHFSHDATARTLVPTTLNWPEKRMLTRRISPSKPVLIFFPKLF